MVVAKLKKKKMNFIKSLFKVKQNKLYLSKSFQNSIEKIIIEIEASNKMLTDDEYYDLISKNTLNIDETNEIYIFLPIAFTQLLIPLKWDNEYIERKKNGYEIIKKFDETDSYKLIMEVSKNYIEKGLKKDCIVNIAGRSAEFNAVNDLLLDGGNIENIKVTKTIIIR